MVVNDNAGWQVPRGVLRFIASKLAPTRGHQPPALKTQNPMSDHGVFCALHITNVGAGLLAKASYHSTLKWLTLPLREQARSHKGICGVAYSGAG